MTPGPRISQNGVSQNGNGRNGHGPPQQPQMPIGNFDRAVILRQSPRWARYVVWGIVSVTVASITWACLAKIEEAIPAQGKLEPKGVVQPVQAPVGGVVEEILVNEGETVEQGQVLVTLDPTATAAELQALKEVEKRLVEESGYYRTQLSSDPIEGAPVTVSPEVARLTSNRAALSEENELYRAILNGGDGGNLSPQQLQRVQASLGDFGARVEINQLEIEQLEEQLTQVRLQLSNARSALENAQSAQEVESNILGRLIPLEEAGAIAELQVLQQEQEVKNRTQAVSDSLTEVNNLQEEEQRLALAIIQANQQLVQTVAASEQDLLERIDANRTQIANIDSQLQKVVVENDKRLEEIAGQIARLEYALANQELRAPVAGQVFNLTANEPGYVANATEPILEIVPGDSLVARVFITNRDIGFVTQQFAQGEPLKVDVRIDSFPFSEFGDVEGTVVHIGSDALPPDEINQFYRFPTEIELETQELSEALPLQSGMSVNANIKLRKRRVITILSDLFVRKLDSLRSGG
ncbi:MAG: HlyD family efflux transporter periplasmic adaptor subunit [Cyanobacteria bacterium J06626_18]